MVSYTPKQKTIINAGWSALMDHAARHGGLGDDRQLAEILKEGRREVRESGVSELTVKAKLLGSLADAAETAPQDLWPLLRSHRDIMAYSWCHRATLVESGTMYAARQAIEAHNRTAERALRAMGTS